MSLERDGRFTVVGEAANGFEAVQIVEATQPDLVILDRHMPRLGGIEALPALRAVAPHAEIVLYTAHPDDEEEGGTAIAAGAVAVLDKRGGIAVVDRIAEVLVDRWASANAEITVRVGPVDSVAVRVWIDNSRQILDAVERHADVIGEAGDPGTLRTFRTLLSTWHELAATNPVFVWVARSDVSTVTRLVETWAAIDGLDDEQLAAMGCHWSPPEAAPFFDALTRGVLEALAAHQATSRLAGRLSAMREGIA